MTDRNKKMTKAEQREQATAMLRRQLERNAKEPLNDLLAEMLACRPTAQDLEREAKRQPLQYIRTVRALGDLLVPRELQVSQGQPDMREVLAEMKRRGLVDDSGAQRMARGAGLTLEHEPRPAETGGNNGSSANSEGGEAD